MMVKDFGWQPNGCRRGVSAGGRRVTNQRGYCEHIRHSCCWRPVVWRRKLRRNGAIWFAETFIDPERFRGTCYRAANWILLGRTMGRGKDDLTHRQNRSIKEVFGLPLTRRFRELLSQ
jgi:hypothetical protein